VDRVVVAIGLGSNLGDRESHLAFARARLTTLLADLQLASIHETDPVGVAGPQGPFLNTAAVGTTTLSARELLNALQQIERDRGRERPFPGAARTLDLDLLLYGETTVSDLELRIPHPRFRDRLFVLEPLAEIAPALRDPVTGLTVQELLTRLQPEPPGRAP
jgi:2-amino-4-hydroxy-6-hydroxymethyldihydropteridine diphosphokinase